MRENTLLDDVILAIESALLALHNEPQAQADLLAQVKAECQLRLLRYDEEVRYQAEMRATSPARLFRGAHKGRSV